MTISVQKGIVVDDKLADELEAIANGPDDLGELVRMSDIDPDEFTAFLAENRLLDDPDAQLLLGSAVAAKAAGESAVPRVSPGEAPRRSTEPTTAVELAPLSIHRGPGHFFAEWYRASLRQLDHTVNALVGSRILDRTRGRWLEYSSEELVSSLVKLGIPTDACLLVANEVPIQLIRYQRMSEEPITTANIRTAVASSVASLRSYPEYSIGASAWHRSYLQKYGDPDSNLLIVMPDGREEPLSFRFITAHLLPDLFDDYLAVSQEFFRSHVINRAMIDDMSREVLTSARALSAYTVRYGTLLEITRETALQPPRLWLSERPFANWAWEYELHSAEQDLTALGQYVTTGSPTMDLALRRDLAREALEHSCAAILSFYGGFIGLGANGTLGIVTHSLRQDLDTPHIRLLKHAKTDLLRSDLEAVGESPFEIQEAANRGRKLLQTQNETGLEKLSSLAERFSSIARAITDVRERT